MKTKIQIFTARSVLLALTSAFILQPSTLVLAAPLGTAFTYQGRLNDTNGPVNGYYDFFFSLYDSASGDAGQIGPSIPYWYTPVSNGLFAVSLDFGNAFAGNATWLQISARTNGSITFTNLSPRQPLTPAPYAIFATSAGAAATATTAASANSVAAANITGTMALTQLPSAVLTNNQSGVTLKGLTTVSNLSVTATNFANYLVVTNPPWLNGSGITNLNATNLTGTVPDARLAGNVARTNQVWLLNGNAGTTGANYLGTTDSTALELRVNGARALRLEPNATSPNVIGGYSGNVVSNGFHGATIGGGGYSGFPNRVGAIYATVVGGRGNTASGDISTAMGEATTASGIASTAMGYYTTASGYSSTAMGYGPTASGYSSTAMGYITSASGYYSTAMGYGTTASGYYSTAMGSWTIASGFSSTAMGENTTASGHYSTAMGYQSAATNLLTLAAGRRAKAVHQGAFVWADSQDSDFASTADNQFLIRAAGFVGINKNNPATALDVNGTVTATGFSGNGSGITNLSGAQVWLLNGNAGTAGANYLGTADSTALELRVNGQRALRLEPNATSPNVIGGYSGNVVSNGFYGATIGGGGFSSAPNRVGADYATVVGGVGNTASGGYSTAMGIGTTASGSASTAMGFSTVASGGFSMAAGFQAQAIHASTFVWADSQNSSFASTASDQFLIRAQGGVGIGAAPSDAMLDVEGDLRVNDHALWLRGGTDRNHGLSWYSSGTFAGSNPDGPVLFGCGGGALGTACSSQVIALQWNSSGNVGIGRASAVNRLEVEGNASKTTAGSWVANSDARIKRDIEPVAGALEKLDKVRLVSFRYTEGYRKQHPTIEDRPYLNVVAQEFQTVFPESVRPGGDQLPDSSPILAVDTYPLTIYSAAAVQELNQKLKQKDAEVQELKKAGAELKRRLEKLEQLITAKNGGGQ